MKCMMVLILCLFLNWDLNAQISSHNLFPSSTPTEGDTIKSFLTLLIQGGVSKQSSNLTFNDDSIFYNSCYQKINVQSEEYVYDTVIIPPLSIGIYHFVIHINHTPANIDTYCQNTDVETRFYDTVITVSKYSGISYASMNQLQAVMLNDDIVQLYAPHTGTASVRVYDALGQLRHSSQAQIYEGRNEITLDIPNLPSGLYLYHVQLGEQRRVLKLVKQ